MKIISRRSCRIAILLLLFTTPALLHARPIEPFDWDRSSKEADVIIIGIPVTTKDAEVLKIDGHDAAMKVKTTFKVLMLIKGEKLVDKRADEGFQVTVTHYRPFGEWAAIAAMNMTFLSFPDKDKSGEVAYLLFLVRGQANELRVLSPEESIFVVHNREKLSFLTIKNAEANKSSR